MLNQLKKEMLGLKNPEKIKIYANFFKTGKGQYGEGDIFYGLTMPQQHNLAKKYIDLSLKDIKKLLMSKIHEHRQTCLLILVKQYQKANQKEKKRIYNFYLKNTKRINNWDLVDGSAHYIMGDYLLDRNKSIIYKLAKSDNLWEKRISILTTFQFIRNNKFEDTLKISEILLNDQHDLIHKAVGWMLREVGKKDQKVEEKFLKKYYKHMPRTMLRYAIERFGEKKRKFYMKR